MMSLYFLFTRPAPAAWANARSLAPLQHQVADCVRVHCPELTWVANFRMPGRESYLDLVEAPYGDAVLRLAVLIRQHGFSQVEMQPAINGLLDGDSPAAATAGPIGPGWSAPGPAGRRAVACAQSVAPVGAENRSAAWARDAATFTLGGAS